MLGHYLTIALRNLGRAPFTAAVNVLTLALGLVAFVGAYAVSAYWGSSERIFPNSARTYVITASLALKDGSVASGKMPQTTELYKKYLQIDFPEVETIARANVWNRQSSVSANGRMNRLVAVAVDPEFLDIFDLPFIAGDPRTALRSPDGVLLTEAAAVRMFGTADVLGKTVTMGGNLLDATVTGVIAKIPEPSHMATGPSASMPFDLMASYDLYDRLRQVINRPRPQPGAAPPGGNTQPAGGNAQQSGTPAQAAAATPPPAADPAAAAPDAAPPPQRENWLGGYCCTTYVMLKRDGSLTGKELERRLEDFARRRVPPDQLEIANVDIGAVPVTGLMVTQLDAQLLGKAGRWVSIPTLLFALGALVLFVACVNYANLATARAARRAREIGLRKVVGAHRGQIVGQYLLEAALLTAVALAVAVAAVELVAPVVRNAVGIDMRLALLGSPRFWVFIAALLAGVTVLGGAYPAFVLSRVRPIEALRLGRVRIGPRFASTILVGAQFAAASFLLIAVLVMYLQNAELERTALGTTRDQHLVVNNFTPVTGVSGDVLLDELARLPGAKSVTAMGAAPWSDNVNLELLSRSPEAAAGFQTAFQNAVAYDFFETLDIPLIAGRAFDRDHNDMPPQNQQQDAGQNTNSAPPPTMNIVIDRVLASQLNFASPQEAVDQIIYVPAAMGEQAQPMRVVGVVESRPLFLKGFGATSNMYRLVPGGGMQNMIVRFGPEDVAAGVAAAEAAWRRLATQAPFSRRFMDEMFNQGYELFSRVNQVSAGLALFAFVISVIGLFGMAIQVASRRTHEIGVRKSVGARKRQIVAMLIKDASKPVIIANVLAWPLGYLAGKAYLSVFIQRMPLTPLPFLASLTVVVLIAWAAVGSQALRASRANPATVLRFE
jgi:putative ABC transport system permease protein